MHASCRFPWLTPASCSPRSGAVWVRSRRDPDAARRRSLVASGLALACAVGGLAGLRTCSAGLEAHDRWDLLAGVFCTRPAGHRRAERPLLPLAALIYFLTILATLRTKVREFSFARSLGSEAILLATLACKLPWGVVALLAAGTVPPYLELRRAGSRPRVYAAHMGLFVALLVARAVAARPVGGRARGSPWRDRAAGRRRAPAERRRAGPLLDDRPVRARDLRDGPAVRHADGRGLRRHAAGPAGGPAMGLAGDLAWPRWPRRSTPPGWRSCSGRPAASSATCSSATPRSCSSASRRPRRSA